MSLNFTVNVNARFVGGEERFRAFPTYRRAGWSVCILSQDTPANPLVFQGYFEQWPETVNDDLLKKIESVVQLEIGNRFPPVIYQEALIVISANDDMPTTYHWSNGKDRQLDSDEDEARCYLGFSVNSGIDLTEYTPHLEDDQEE